MASSFLLSRFAVFEVGVGRNIVETAVVGVALNCRDLFVFEETVGHNLEDTKVKIIMEVATRE